MTETKATSDYLNRPAHKSDCAVHNEPASSMGPCDCGAIVKRPRNPLERDLVGVLAYYADENRYAYDNDCCPCYPNPGSGRGPRGGFVKTEELG